MIAKIVFGVFCLAMIVSLPIIMIVDGRRNKKEIEEAPESWEVIERP